jgi:hypothetical protein
MGCYNGRIYVSSIALFKVTARKREVNMGFV